jgi:hypothetical protein
MPLRVRELPVVIGTLKGLAYVTTGESNVSTFSLVATRFEIVTVACGDGTNSLIGDIGKQETEVTDDQAVVEHCFTSLPKRSCIVAVESEMPKLCPMIEKGRGGNIGKFLPFSCEIIGASNVNISDRVPTISAIVSRVVSVLTLDIADMVAWHRTDETLDH